MYLGFFKFLNSKGIWSHKYLEFRVLKLFFMGLITWSTNLHQSIMHYQRLYQFILYFCHFATECVPLQILYFSALVRILLVVTLDSSTTCSRTVLLSTSLGIDRIKSTPCLGHDVANADDYDASRHIMMANCLFYVMLPENDSRKVIS